MLMLYCRRQLHSYNFVPDIINLISEEIHKVITAVLDTSGLEAFFFVSLATVSNRYLRLCLFSSNRFEK